MKVLDADTLRRFVTLAGDRLSGEWLVIGGAVLPLLGVVHRTTVDIDLAGPDDAGNAQMVALMGIASELGLAPESINQAGAYFVRTIEGWRDEIVEFHRGSDATIFLPNVTLYLLLKIDRLSESDVDDCVERVRLGSRRGETIDVDRVLRRLDEKSPDGPTKGRIERVRELLAR